MAGMRPCSDRRLAEDEVLGWLEEGLRCSVRGVPDHEGAGAVVRRKDSRKAGSMNLSPGREKSRQSAARAVECEIKMGSAESGAYKVQ